MSSVPGDTTLERLLDLQQQHLVKITALVDRFADLAAENQKANERYRQMAELWEKDHKESVECERKREKELRVRGIIGLVIWALIPIAIIVAHFL